MRTFTRSRHVAGAAALALSLGACGSDGSDGSSDGEGSSGSASTSADSSASADSSDSDGDESDTGSSISTSATADGTELEIDGWRTICARSGDGTKGSAVLMEDVSLDQLQESDYEIGSVMAHFDIDGDTATLTTISIGRPADQMPDDAIGDLRYSAATSEGSATVEVTEEAVHIEGTGEETSTEGKRREGIPFTIDVECTSWEDLTDEGDVQPPG